MDFISNDGPLNRMAAIKSGVGSLLFRTLSDYSSEAKPTAVLTKSSDNKTFIVNSDQIWLPKGNGVRGSSLVVASDYDGMQVRLSHDDESLIHNEHSYAIPPHLRGQIVCAPAMLVPLDTSDCSTKSTDMNDGDHSDAELQFAAGGSLLSPANSRIRPGSLAADGHCVVRRQRAYDRLLTTARSGLFPLNDEEKRMCEKEGIRLPLELPLTKSEERIVKRVRRKIRNKRSAQESRKRKQAYVEALEVKVQASSDEILRLQHRLNSALLRNKELEMEMVRMQQQHSTTGVVDLAAVRPTGWSAPHTSPPMRVFLLSVAIAVAAVLNTASPGILRSFQVPGEDGLLADEQYVSRLFNADSQSSTARPLPLLFEHDVLTGLYGDDSADSDDQLMYVKGDQVDSVLDRELDSDFQYLLSTDGVQATRLLLDSDIDFDVELSSLNRMEPYASLDVDGGLVGGGAGGGGGGVVSGQSLVDAIKMEPFNAISADLIDTPWTTTPLATSLFME